jgi:hypothetical protein
MCQFRWKREKERNMNRYKGTMVCESICKVEGFSINKAKYNIHRYSSTYILIAFLRVTAQKWAWIF